MKLTNELDQLKYESFCKLFPAGAVIIVIVLLIELSQKTLSTYDAIMLPLFASVLTGSAIALWRNKSNLRKVEYVIIFDLDHYKQINDVKGHHSGDDVLKTVADTVQKNIRLTDHLGRWGGDEFLVIVPETNLGNTLVMAEKLRKTIEETRKNDSPIITASFGVANCTPSDTPESLVSRADGELLKAKRNGKNRVEVG